MLEPEPETRTRADGVAVYQYLTSASIGASVRSGPGCPTSRCTAVT